MAAVLDDHVRLRFEWLTLALLWQPVELAHGQPPLEEMRRGPFGASPSREETRSWMACFWLAANLALTFSLTFEEELWTRLAFPREETDSSSLKSFL